MDVVVITARPEDGEAAERRAAELIERTLYEARQLVQEPLPRALTVCPDRAQAESLANALREVGWGVHLFPVDAERPVVDLREIRVGEHESDLRSAGGESLRIAHDACRLLLVGVRVVTRTRTVEERQRRLSAGRALISGGLSMSKKVTTERTVSESTATPFARLFVDGLPAMEMTQDGLRYEALGDAMEAASVANFTATIALLRSRAPRMLVDERLRQRIGFSRLLPPVLRNEQHDDLAVALLGEALLIRPP